MANPRYNQQVTNRRGAMGGGRMKKMGGGMMKRKPMMKGSKPDFLDLDKDKNNYLIINIAKYGNSAKKPNKSLYVK